MSECNELIKTVKQMAKACGLQNWEQIGEERGAIGAVRMIQSEYLDLLHRYIKGKNNA